MSLAVSVLIPTYNREQFIPEVLDSILSQTCAPAEIIVVDDGSTDNTREAVARFGNKVRYHLVQNGGACRARNIAASLATSPFLAFCDSDDLWRSDKLQQQMDLHERNPGLQYSFTNFALFSHTGDVWSERTKLDDAPKDFFAPFFTQDAKTFVYQDSLYDQLLRFQPIWPSTVVLSRQLFAGLDGFQEQFGRNPSEDFEFTLRCVQKSPTGVVLDPVVGVRRHTSNFSVDVDKNTLGQLEILNHALRHHTISASTRTLIQDQINLRRVEASYGAFRRSDFTQTTALLNDVPSHYLDTKTRLKLWISRLPIPLARTVQKLLLKEPPQSPPQTA